jgi:hypothetical protein
MKYAVGMGLVSMMYIPSFMKIVSCILKFGGGIYRHTGWESHKPL